MICPASHYFDVYVVNCNATYSIRQQRPIISSQTILFHDTYLHPSLIHSRLSLVEVMRIHFYRGLSDTEVDGGGLQWNFISRC